MGDAVEVTGKPRRRRGPGDLAGPGAAWVTVWVTATCPRHRPSFDRPVAVTRDGTGTLPLSKMSLQQNVCLKRFKHKQRPSALRKEKKSVYGNQVGFTPRSRWPYTGKRFVLLA